MKVVFSDHASLKVEQRRLSREKVLAVVARPDLRRPTYGGREEWFKRFGKNYLEVVIVREHDTIVIVTAHWVARTPKK